MVQHATHFATGGTKSCSVPRTPEEKDDLDSDLLESMPKIFFA